MLHPGTKNKERTLSLQFDKMCELWFAEPNAQVEYRQRWQPEVLSLMVDSAAKLQLYDRALELSGLMYQTLRK